MRASQCQKADSFWSALGWAKRRANSGSASSRLQEWVLTLSAAERRKKHNYNSPPYRILGGCRFCQPSFAVFQGGYVRRSEFSFAFHRFLVSNSGWYRELERTPQADLFARYSLPRPVWLPRHVTLLVGRSSDQRREKSLNFAHRLLQRNRLYVEPVFGDEGIPL